MAAYDNYIANSNTSETASDEVSSSECDVQWEQHKEIECITINILSMFLWQTITNFDPCLCKSMWVTKKCLCRKKGKHCIPSCLCGTVKNPCKNKVWSNGDITSFYKTITNSNIVTNSWSIPRFYIWFPQSSVIRSNCPKESIQVSYLLNSIL